MPVCSAISCTNSSENGYLLYTLPQGGRNETRRNQWILNIGIPHLSTKSAICEMHFTDDQFEYNRVSEKRVLKRNAIPTVFGKSDAVSLRRSQRKRTLIEEDHLEWPPKKASGAENLKNITKTNLKKSDDVEENRVDDCGLKEVTKRKGSNKINAAFANDGTRRSRKKKEFDLEGFLMDVLKGESSFNIEHNNKEECSTAEEHGTSNEYFIGEVNPDSSVVKSVEQVMNEGIVEEIADKNVSGNAIIDTNCDNKTSNVNSIKTVHNITYKGFNLITSATSNLEDFAEIISEEPTPKRRISSLGCERKLAVKKIIRVSTNNICRICGKLSSSLLPIFTFSGKSRRVPMYIAQYLPIEVSSTDIDWPKKICEFCVRSLIEWNELYTKCKKVDAMFGKLLNRSSSNVSDDKQVSHTSVEDKRCSIKKEYLKVSRSHIDHSYDKPDYKIGITLIKNRDCSGDTALDIGTLKSIIISKVNNLFHGLCDNERLEKSLVNRTEYDDVTEEDTDDYSVIDNKNELTVSRSEKKHTKLVKKTRRKREEFNKIRLPRIQEAVISDETGSYLCSDCGVMISERKSFLTHRRVYHREKRCRYCNEVLSSLRDYKRHLRVSHFDKISNCCEICDATFIKRERLQRHKLVIHNIGEYVYCDICNKKCASRQQLYGHKSDAHNKMKSSCDQCGQNFASHQSFLTHLKKKHSYNDNLSCMNCDKTFRTRSNLEIHMEKCQNENMNITDDMKISSKTNRKMYTCLICSVRITDEEILKQHMEYHANDEYIKNLVAQEEKSDYDCMLCGKYLKSEKDLALHRFYSHQEPPFICRVSDCNVTFWKRMSLIIHQSTVHKMLNNSCNICSISFTNSKEKRRHMKSHHPSGTARNKPYACSICNKRFCWKYTLKTHMVIHSDVKMYKCNLCGKEFKLKLTLSKHMQYHERKRVLEEEVNACEETEVAEIGDIASIEGLEIVNEGVLKLCTVFKCPECSILFTHKETFDNHYLEEHAVKEAGKYELVDTIN